LQVEDAGRDLELDAGVAPRKERPDHLAQRGPWPLAASGLVEPEPQRMQRFMFDVGEHHVLFMGQAQFAEAVALGKVGDAVHPGGHDITGRHTGLLQRDRHRSIATDPVRMHVARDPAREGTVLAQVLLVRGRHPRQRPVSRPREAGFDARDFRGGQRAGPALEERPLVRDLAAELGYAQFLHQHLDARPVLAVAPSMPVVHAQDRIEAGQQVGRRQELADHIACDRRAPGATPDHHREARPAIVVEHRLQADVLHHHCCTVLWRARQCDPELVRQEGELRVQRRPLPDDLDIDQRVEHLVGRDTGEMVDRRVEDAIATGLDRVKVDLGQFVQDVGHPL
jgi:hypothetical protein